MTRWNFRRDTSSTKFRALLETTHSVCNLSCTERAVNSKPSADPDAPGMTGMFGMKRPTKSAMMMIRKAPTAKGKSYKGKAKRPLDVDSSDSNDYNDSDGSVAGHGTDDEAEHSSMSDADSAVSERLSDGAGSESEYDLTAEPWNAIGVKSYDHAPARRNKNMVCLVCEQCFEPGELRMDSRSRVSNSLRDQKRFHPRCIDRLPEYNTKKRDILVLKSWLREELSASNKATMETALAALQAL
jgi:hypothetical protein